MAMNAKDIIRKRQQLWNGNIEEDKTFIESAAEYILSPNGEKIREEIKNNPEYLIELAFCIVDKNQNTVPFFINKVQRRFLETLNQARKDFAIGKRLHLKFLVLKGRQQGFTSIITAYQLACSITQKNFAGFTLADDGDNTITIFSDKAKYAYDNLPDRFKPTEKYNNRKEFHFETLNSRWRVATAGGKGVGRSKTLNFFHGSEVAFWDNLREILTGLNPALTKDSIQVLESTANGFNEFKELWDSDNNWEGLFYEWWETPEYRQNFESDEYREQFIHNVQMALPGVSDSNSDGWVYYRCKWLHDTIELDWEQIYWYHNQWKDYREDIKQEYPCTPEESFLATGKPVFDLEQVNYRLKELTSNPIGERGNLKFNEDRKVVFVPDHNGYVTIYEQPKKDYPYAIGADVAEGTINGDYDAAHVLDNITLNQVAVFHGKTDVDLYAIELDKLGRFYNNAVLAPEVNFNPGIVINLEKMGYPKQYMRQSIDKITKDIQMKFGFKTDRTTRPVIISDLVELVREHIHLINDVATLREMIVFIKNDQGRPEAQQGKHDDLIMALAIALKATEQQTKVSKERQLDLSKLPEDMKQDYDKATPEMKKYLADKWKLYK
jgi:hypothetical protein